jgi:2-polyprenyl-3-methyl-5-hydroxy-6-metoxy-1,4-benzoquinol methylase
VGRDLFASQHRLEALEKARESLGRDLFASQHRLDALEKDRDQRFEALARRQEREEAEKLALADRIESATEGLRALRLEWSSLRSSLRDLSGAPPRVSGDGADGARFAAVRADDALRAGLYVDFEEHFRGSEKDIRARQASDAIRFRGAPGPVADLGCGRGEFLEALAAEGVAAIGCDANPVMAARAKEKKLTVDQADLFAWLAGRTDGSLGGVTAFQVVEHLPPASLFDLVELAIQKLAPSGRVLFETINPESVYAMRWFWMDLTHVRPVPAPSLAQLLRASGFRDVAVDFRSPVPESEGLPAGLADDPRFAPLARLLFAPQDYAVTGVK